MRKILNFFLGSLIIKGAEYDINSSKYVFHLNCNMGSLAFSEFLLRVYVLNDNNEYLPLISTDPSKRQKKGIVEWNPFFISSSKIIEEVGKNN